MTDMTSPSTPLSEYLQQIIRAQGGAISFAHFMEIALYHPTWGYYNSANFTLGKAGDFTTAPEISPLFAHTVAQQCLAIFPQLAAQTILEIGAGSGKFACDLLQALAKAGALPRHYFILEISPHLQNQQRQLLQASCPDWMERIVWLTQLPANFAGMVIANEVLDALPVERFCIQQGEVLAQVVTLTENKLAWQLQPIHDAALRETANQIKQEYALTEGYEFEINTHLSRFIQQLAESLTQGVILLFDYGYGRREYYHPQRRQGTLTCFYQHKQHADPLQLPGQQDITAHVDFTAVAEYGAEFGCEIAGFTTQSAFLLNCGLLDLVAARAISLSPAEELALHQQVKTLTMPMEMGETIKVMALTKNLPFPLIGFARQDRRRDL